MMRWRVLFLTGEALYVEADSALAAKVMACILAWSISGQWLGVREVSCV